MPDNVVLFALVVGTIANTVFPWPQARRAVHTRNLAGVSPSSWVLSYVTFAVWGAWATVHGEWALLAANVSCLTAGTIILTVGVKSGWSWRYPLGAGLAVGAAVCFGFLLPVVLGVFMVISGVVMRVPQLVKAFIAPDTSGVSVGTWLVSAFAASGWLIVAIDRGYVPIVLATSLTLVTTVVLLKVVAVRRQQVPPEPKS